jgi:hypothetical protein
MHCLGGVLLTYYMEYLFIKTPQTMHLHPFVITEPFAMGISTNRP